MPGFEKHNKDLNNTSNLESLKMNQYSKLLLSLVSGVNQGITGEMGADVFRVSAEEAPDVPLFEIAVSYAAEEGQTDSLTCKRLTSLDASELPFVSCGVHLASMVYFSLSFLMTQAECEFLADVFDEFGDEEGEIPFSASAPLESV